MVLPFAAAGSACRENGFEPWQCGPPSSGTHRAEKPWSWSLGLGSRHQRSAAPFETVVDVLAVDFASRRPPEQLAVGQCPHAGGERFFSGAAPVGPFAGEHAPQHLADQLVPRTAVGLRDAIHLLQEVVGFC